MSDNDFALLRRKMHQRCLCFFGTESARFISDEPVLQVSSSQRLMSLPPARRSRCAYRGVSDRAIEPAGDIFRRLLLAAQLDEGFLNDIFRRGTPLTGIQHQGRPVLV